VYKVIFEDANFRVVEANRQAGIKDKAHGHPVPSVVYYVNDCKSKLTGADGKARETVNKAGTANAVPIIASHTAENIGTTSRSSSRRSSAAKNIPAPHGAWSKAVS